GGKVAARALAGDLSGGIRRTAPANGAGEGALCMKASREWLACAALAAVLAGCAGAPVREEARDALAEAIAGYNDEELFACGSAAWQAQDYPRAAACFARLAERFPASRHWRDAMFNAGAALEAQELWQPALERYLGLLDG